MTTPRFFFIIGVLFLLVTPAWGQDLSNRIPPDAVGAVKFNTPRFFELVEVDEFARSWLGEAFVRLLDEDGIEQAGLADCGIALDRAAYMYALHTDSVRFTVFLWPISDSEKMMSTLFYGKEIADLGGGHRQTVDRPDYAYGKTTVYTWDESVLTVILPEQAPGYFDDPAVASRYGITNRSYYDFYSDYSDSPGQDAYSDYGFRDEADVESADVLIDSVGVLVCVEALPEDSRSGNSDTDTSDWDWDEGRGTDANVDGDWYSEYEALSEADQRIKDSVLTVWTTGYFQQLLANASSGTAAEKASYADALNDEAIVSAWIRDFAALYDFVWPEIFGSMTGSGFMYTGAMRLNAFADKDLRITSSMDIADPWVRPIGRMYDRKINRKYFRYIDSDEIIGIYGFAANTQAILEELPELLGNSYGALAWPYEEELGLVTEAFSLLLDEAAVGRALRGDGVFVLNGLEEQDVPFTHYDWDEDYNIIEVDSLRKELVPDFLLMLSSDDRALYDRYTAYAVTKGNLTDHGRFVEVQNTNMPFSLYLAHHRGILFVSTSLTKMEDIVQDRHKGKMARHHRRMLRQNTAAGVFNVANLGKELDNAQLNTLERYLMLRNIFGSMGDMEYRVRINGRRMDHEFVSRTPSEYPNAIYQLISLVDYAMEAM